jgi:ABC-type Fe3+-hydroxamate transport system substrate-binding protein
LYSLGLSHEVLAQTIFCIHPKEMHQSKPKIGGTKKLKLDLIRTLQPDLIIGNKEENEKDQLEELMDEFPVWISDIKNLEDAYRMISGVGELVCKEAEAQQFLTQLQNEFDSLLVQTEPKKCLYLIWREPWMAAGNDTFINDMLQRMGCLNAANKLARYPILTQEEIKVLNPDLVFLSSEPYPFKKKHIEELKAFLPEANIMLVDGELFSWYGSRLLSSAKYFKQLLNEVK